MESLKPLKYAIDEFLMFVDVKTITLKNYKSVFKRYLNYLEGNNITAPNRRTIIEYKEYLRESGVKAYTISKAIIILKNFYKWARRHVDMYNLDESFRYDIAEGIRNVRVNPFYRKQPLTIEQVRTLLEYLENKTSTLIGLRNYAIALLMVTTGLRGIEVVRIKKKDIASLEGKQIVYVQGKGDDDQDNYVKLPKRVIDAIATYLALRVDPNPYLFIAHHYRASDNAPLKRANLTSMITKALKACELYSSKITAHSLRHTAATINLKHGGSLESTRVLLRHRSIHSTLIYAHQIEKLKDESESRIENIVFEGDNK